MREAANQRMKKLSLLFLVTALSLVVYTSSLKAQSVFLGSDFTSDFVNLQPTVLYDVDPVTGAATNPRSTNINLVIGIEYSAAGILYGVTGQTTASNPNTTANALYTIDPFTGASTLIGATGLGGIGEGDLAFDPTTSTMFGVFNTTTGPSTRRLYTIDLSTGVATQFAGFGLLDISGLAFDATGILYGLDNGQPTGSRLVTFDKSTGAIVTSVNLSVELGSLGGLRFNPLTGTLFAVDGGTAGTDTLYTVNIATGQLTSVGSTGLANGLSGLAIVPEPSSIALFAFGLGAVGLLCWRKSSRRF